MILADKIIKERKKLGLSQEELAERVNVSRQAVSKWEGNQSLPEIDKILQMSSIFGVSTDYLLKDEIESDEKTEKTEPIAVNNENACAEKDNNSDLSAPKGDCISAAAVKSDDTGGIRKVTLNGAKSFLAWKKRAARNISLGVCFCTLFAMSLLSVFMFVTVGRDVSMDYDIDPMISSVEDEYFIPEDVVVSGEQGVNGSVIGAVSILAVPLMFIFIAAAVGLFVHTGIKNQQYKFIDIGLFETEEAVTEMVRERQIAFKRAYTVLNIFGAVLCVLSAFALAAGIVNEIVGMGIPLFNGMELALFLAGTAAVLFISAGVPYSSMQKLLK